MLVQSVQQQKAALAEFGIEAFRTDDLDALLTRAAVLAGQGLGVERAKVLELLPPGDQLLIRAGVGWEPDVVGHATIDADADQADATLTWDRAAGTRAELVFPV